MGKPWPMGKPSVRIERRSGGNEKLKVDSMANSSVWVRPWVTGTLQWWWRWVMRFFEYAANEKQALVVDGMS